MAKASTRSPEAGVSSAADANDTSSTSCASKWWNLATTWIDKQGGYQTQYTDPTTGKTSSLSVIENPQKPGTFVPGPNTTPRAIQANINDPGFIEGVSSIASSASASGQNASAIKGWEDAEDALRKLPRGRFDPGLYGEKQFQDARKQIIDDMVVHGSQLIKNAPFYFSEEAKTIKGDEADHSDFVDAVVDRWHKLQAEQSRGPFRRKK